MLLVPTVFTALLVLLVSSSQAGNPHTFSFPDYDPSGTLNIGLEENNCSLSSVPHYCYPDTLVVNPTNCAWDINDHYGASDVGQLESGVSTSISRCVISNDQPKYVSHDGILTWRSGANNAVGVSVSAPSSALQLTVCFQPQERCFYPQSLWNGNSYKYSFCGYARYDSGDPALSVIPGSTPNPVPYGTYPGWGLITTASITLTNPTSKTVKNLSGYWMISSDVIGCQPGPDASQDYPWVWVQS